MVEFYLGAYDAPQIGSVVVTGSGLAAVLTLSDGSQFVFTQSSAVDRGSYMGPFVKQRWFESRNSSAPDWCIMMRRECDATGNYLTGASARDEFVIEKGRIRTGSIQNEMSGFSISFRKDDAIIQSGFIGYNMPVNALNGVSGAKHFGFARWRFHTGVRPFVRTTQELIDNRWVHPLSTEAMDGKTASNVASGNYTHVMSKGGLPRGIGAGGEGQLDHIGLITGYQGEYVLFGTANAKQNMMAMAEGHATMAIHYRDERTGTVLSYKSEVARVDGTLAAPLTLILPNDNDPGDADYITWYADGPAHAPSATYLPYLYTDDPYYLEELEFVARRVMAEPGAISFANTLRNSLGVTEPWGIPSPEQQRTWAWGIRPQFQLRLVAPSSSMATLEPAEYWQAAIDRSQIAINKYSASPSLVHQRFHAFTRAAVASAYMGWYQLLVLEWARWAGVIGAEWDPQINWVWGAYRWLINGSSGWPRNWPTPYSYYHVVDHSTWADTQLFTTLVIGSAVDSVTGADPAALWSFFKSEQIVVNGASSIVDETEFQGDWIRQRYQGNIGSPGASGATHVQIMRAALNMAVRNERSGVRDIYSWAAVAVSSYVPQGPGGANFMLQRYAITPVSA